jgi:SNF2 family DNA or RNA helicase
MTREEFGDLFPSSHIIPEAYDMGSNGPKIQKVYLDMEYELAALDERCEGYSSHVFSIMMAARRKAELLKVPLFCDKIEDMFDEGMSVAVFCNFTDTIAAITDRLSKLKKFAGKIAHVVGGQNEDTRAENINGFQSNEKRVVLCNIAAGGVAISLHDVKGTHPRASIISPTWSSQNLVQATGRVWRQGGTNSIQYICYAVGCIEEEICKRVQMKVDMLSTLNDGDMSESLRVFA